MSPGVLLYGRMDRVDQEGDGSWHIIDYKTGKLAHPVDWGQLEFHALTLSLTSPTPVRRVSFLHLEGPTLTSRELRPEDLEQTRWQVLRIAVRIRRERGHLPHPGPWCRDCDFSPICPGRELPASPAGLAGQRELWEEPPDDP